MFPRSSRLSAIPERGSSSAGDDSLCHDTPIHPLATPPPSGSRRGSAASAKTSSPTQTSFPLSDGPLSAMPCSGLSHSSYTPAYNFDETPVSEPQRRSPPPDSLQTLHDKLDAISEDGRSPEEELEETGLQTLHDTLDAISEDGRSPGETEELLAESKKMASSGAPDTNDEPKDSYCSVKGASLEKPDAALSV